MTARSIALLCCTAMSLWAPVASAGPCDTAHKDAGAGPTPGYQDRSTTTGSADARNHPPTASMNQATGSTATSSQDAQRQQQGQPTAAHQAEGARPETKGTGADDGC
jgi:hypothetical protein